MSEDLLTTLRTSLGGAYLVERELGGGGMSRVFKATETSLGRSVVIKVVAPDLIASLSAERFTREVKVAARLQQANIVPLLNAGDAGGVAYYTMPFVEGHSLRARLQGGQLTMSEALNVLRDVARALAYAHAQGVVHRDIKPENVLLSGGTAMVTDFGIAKALTESRPRDGSPPLATGGSTLTSAGSSLGTPAYMAPEQAVGADVDLRADLYAWAVMAYELLTGAHPYAGRTTPQQLIAAHIAEVPAPIAAKNPHIAAPVASIVMRCLEKEPGRRPTSAGDVLTAIDTVETPSRENRAPAVARRPYRTVGILAVVAVIVATAGWLGSRRGGGPTTAAAAGARTLAVIPFESPGGDTANSYFAEGVADEVTTALTRTPGLRLAGRASAARFRGRGASAPEIGEALKVSSVLSGTVRRAGDRVRVTAELTSASDGHVVWQETYERRVEDVFGVQDEIAVAIASALQVQLTAGAGGSVASTGTNNFQAYDFYLRGLQLYRSRRGPELQEAERVLRQAVTRDPGFARAYATLASTLLVQPYYLDIRMGAVLPAAREAAEKAIGLAPDLPEALAAMGHVNTEAFEWKEAEQRLERAVALAPDNSEIGFRLGFMYITSGRSSRAIASLQHVRDVDPFYSMPAIYLAWALALEGRSAEAIAEAKRALALDPSNEALNNVYANSLLAAGAVGEAVTHAQRVVQTTTNPRRLGFYAGVIGLGSGDVSGIDRRLSKLPPDTWGLNAAKAYLALARKDTSAALDYMEKAAAGDGDLLLAQASNSSLFEPVRRSPRFARVMTRFNLEAGPNNGAPLARPK